jgi:hypothetical protein
MHADAGPQVGVRLGDLAHLRELLHRRADAQRPQNLLGAHRLEDFGQPGAQFGKDEVTV